VTRVVKYFNTGEKDLPASIAAECAGQQDKFKEYYDILFGRQDDWINLSTGALNAKFTNYAVELGMSRSVFAACLNNENVKQVVLSHFNEAGSLGISAAPTLVVNNNVLVGTYPEDSLIKTVQEIITADQIDL
jgi:protein-disulfide isomerase